jgi:hypothetical protein
MMLARIKQFPGIDRGETVEDTQRCAVGFPILLIRYLFGLTGPTLTAGAVGNSATRADAAAIKTYLDGIRPALDIDGNGTATALTDGLLVLRYLFGLRGGSLIAGAVDPAGVRKTATEIETCIQSLMP